MSSEPIALLIDNQRVIRRACPLFPPQCHPIHPPPCVVLTMRCHRRVVTMMMRFVPIHTIDAFVVESWMQEDAPQPMEHVIKWKSIREAAIIVTGTNVYIPQTIYQPYTEADRIRYIEKADLKEPILFQTAHPDQWGIALDDALKAKMKDLVSRDDNMFENCGPSVSIRLQVTSILARSIVSSYAHLQWPGYRAWTKQIPTMDFKSPKGPITRAKLAKNIANCVKRFIEVRP